MPWSRASTQRVRAGSLTAPSTGRRAAPAASPGRSRRSSTVDPGPKPGTAAREARDAARCGRHGQRGGELPVRCVDPGLRHLLQAGHRDRVVFERGGRPVRVAGRLERGDREGVLHGFAAQILQHHPVVARRRRLGARHGERVRPDPGLALGGRGDPRAALHLPEQLGRVVDDVEGREVLLPVGIGGDEEHAEPRPREVPLEVAHEHRLGEHARDDGRLARTPREGRAGRREPRRPPGPAPCPRRRARGSSRLQRRAAPAVGQPPAQVVPVEVEVAHEPGEEVGGHQVLLGEEEEQRLLGDAGGPQGVQQGGGVVVPGRRTGT